MTIGGSNFANGVVVTFGGTAAAGVTVVSSSLLTATTPAHAAGAVAVVVTNPDSGTSTLPNGFTYVAATAPTVTGITRAPGHRRRNRLRPHRDRFRARHDGDAGWGGGRRPAGAIADHRDRPHAGPHRGHGGRRGHDRRRHHDAGCGFTYQSGSGGGPGDQDGDGLPDTCETQFGLDPQSGVGADGAAGDPDGDGRTNAQECSEGTHPARLLPGVSRRGRDRLVLRHPLELLNPGTVDAKALIRYQTETGTTPSQFLVVPAHTRRTVNPETHAGPRSRRFSTLVESDQRLVVERAMQWGPSHYGSSAETATSVAEHDVVLRGRGHARRVQPVLPAAEPGRYAGDGGLTYFGSRRRRP